MKAGSLSSLLGDGLVDDSLLVWYKVIKTAAGLFVFMNVTSLKPHVTWNK